MAIAVAEAVPKHRAPTRLAPPHGPWAPALLATAAALSACASATATATTISALSAGLWWFATLALVGLAGAGYALGRLNERKALAAELFEARSQHAALLGSLTDTVWRSDAGHRFINSVALPTPGHRAGSQPPAWFDNPGLQQKLLAQHAFADLWLRADERAEVPGPDWLLHGQPLLDQQGEFAGFVGTARMLPAANPAGPLQAPQEPQEPQKSQAPQAPQEAVDTPTAAASATAATSQATAAESNEADNFSLTVAHDLRAPIRVVDGFTRIVKEDYGHLLDRVGNDHLDRVLNAAARMNKMIDALLTLARLSNQPLTRQPVNLSQIAHYVTDELRRSQPNREVEVTIEDGLQVVGDPTLLRLVLENLLGNAWKYSARTPKAQISLSAVRHGSGRAFVVRDNGAGFDMRAAERLFGVFQRLHSASEFAGHGVGLASARRIVSRHGGDIWAEAEPARGADFPFTLASA